MGRTTASSSNMDGTGVPNAYNRVAMDIAIGTVRVTADLIKKTLDCITAMRAQPVPAELLARYGPRIAFVHTALQASGYEPTTVTAYTHVVGEMLVWVDGSFDGDLTAETVAAFLEHFVSRGRKGAASRLGDKSDEDGQGVRYLAYHALKTVLDTLLGMELTHACARPEHPPPTRPASPGATQRLFSVIETDREMLLLVLTNGLKLRPSQSAALTWDCVSPDCRSAIVVNTKGVETVDIDDRCRAVLVYLRERSRRHGFLFPSPRNDGANPLSVRTLQNVLSRLVLRAGIEERVTLTSLRKAGAQIPLESHVAQRLNAELCARKEVECAGTDGPENLTRRLESTGAAIKPADCRYGRSGHSLQKSLDWHAAPHSLERKASTQRRRCRDLVTAPERRLSISISAGAFHGWLGALLGRLRTRLGAALQRTVSHGDVGRIPSGAVLA